MINQAQIETLRNEAVAAGDDTMHVICMIALGELPPVRRMPAVARVVLAERLPLATCRRIEAAYPNQESAIDECARVIADAAAQR